MDAAPQQIKDGMVIGSGVAEWVGGVLRSQLHLSSCEGIGWARNGNIVMGVAFTNYNGASMHMHIAKMHGEVMPPTFVAAIMDYPFVQLGLKALFTLIDEGNGAARGFAEHLGATVQCVLQDASPNGNLVLYGLHKSNARKWLTASYSQRLRSGGINGRRIREG